jgi:hypothetical protein
VASGVTYAYRLNASNSAGASAWSNCAEVTIPLVSPVAPSGLGVTVTP